jgi:hypothetical protein
MSTIIAIADAVAASLNAGTFSQPVAAQRMYQPAFTLEELTELTVSVVPRSTAVAASSRDAGQFDHAIDVGIQKKIAGEDDIDPLLDLVEEIADHLRLKRLPDFPEAAWLGIAHEPVVSTEALSEHRAFTSVLTVTYRIRR